MPALQGVRSCASRVLEVRFLNGPSLFISVLKMTKNEFQRLHTFLKRLKGEQISSSYVYVYIHCAEADRLPRWSSDVEVRKRAGKLNQSLDFHSLQVDLENDVLLGRRSYARNKKEQREIIRIKRGNIKKIHLSVSYHSNGRGNGQYLSEHF